LTGKDAHVTDIDIPPQLVVVRLATERLLASIDGLDDATVRRPSTLPGWDRAMVLTHLARNADGTVRMLEGARRGEVVHQYAHGREGRIADIEAGRGRGAADAAADLGAASARLAEACAALQPGDWDREAEAFAGVVGDRRFPVWHTLASRRREVEVHHGDLDLGYGPGNWPADFVTVELDLVAADLGRRLAPRAALRIVATDGLGEWRAGPEDGEETLVGAPGGQLLAWLLGRPTTIVNPPEIGPWQ
jgi:maleylpyruvate isomerase